MPIFILFSLILTVFSISFALQNTSPVIVKFLFWDFQSELALLLLLVLLIGVVIGIMVSLPSLFRLQKRYSQLKKEKNEQKVPPNEKPEGMGDSSGHGLRP